MRRTVPLPPSYATNETLRFPVPRAERLGLFVVCAVFLVRGLAFHDFVPLWDGRIYTECVLAAARQHTLGALNCADHPTAGYIALLVPGAWLVPGGYAGILGVNLLLGTAALAAFRALLGVLGPGDANAGARVLATAALSTHPVFLASAVNLNPDYGLAVFLVLVLWALVTEQTAFAAVAGTALALSKEPGIGLYVLSVAAWAAFLRPGGWRARLGAVLARPVLAAPFLAVAGYLLTKPRGGTLWGGQTLASVAAQLLVPRLDLFQRLGALWIFAGGFQWLLLAAMAAAAGRALLRLRARPVPRAGAFIGALLVAVGYVLTRHTTFVNPRYFVAAAPLLVAAGYLAVVALPWRRGLAVGFLAVVVGAFAWSSVRTIDPLLRAIYGTFPFGEHALLDTTSVTGECCGMGRDQLAYNLEFTLFHPLQNAVYSDLPRASESVLVAHPSADWFFAGPLDADARRTLQPGEPLVLHTADDVLRLDPLPSRLYFLRLPNFRNGRSLQALSAAYDVAAERRTYAVDGYRLEVFVLERR